MACKEINMKFVVKKGADNGTMKGNEACLRPGRNPRKGGAHMKRKERGTVLTYSLPRRLVVLFLAFALVVYAVGMAVTGHLRANAEEDLQSDYKSRISQLSSQLDDEFSRIQSQMTYILTRSCVQQMELMTASVQFSEYYDAVRQTSELIHSLQNSSGLIEHAVIFFPRLGKSVSYDSVYDTIAQTEYQFLEEYQKVQGRSVFMQVDGSLYLVSDSMRFADKTNSAVLAVEFSRSAIAEWCAFFQEGDAISLLYRGAGSQPYAVFGQALTAEEKEEFLRDLRALEMERKDLAEEDAPLSAKDLPEETAVTLFGSHFLRFLYPVSGGSLWAAGYVNEESLRAAGEPFFAWQVTFTLILLLELTLFFYLIHRMIAKPMERFLNEVSQLKEEGVELPQTEESGDMDFLYRSFVDVSEKLRVSMEQTYRSKLMVYQSEIKFIQAQVRPHFLYNSFYHLYRMAKMEDNEGVAEMSLRLSSYYRYITRSDQNVVPLQMEYHNAADYVEIQKIRFGDRISVELEPLPAEFQNLPVPRFVLQPLFENAYNHGVEKITEGRIVMRFVPTAETLAILVENNGACLQEDLDALTAYLEREDGSEQMTALKNVKGRMKLLGGDLTVSRGSLGGFCATLTLQRNREEEDTCKPS